MVVGKKLWQQIKDLVTLDGRLEHIIQEVTTQERALATNEAVLLQSASLAEEKKKACLGLQKNIDLEELQAKILKDAEIGLRARLDAVSNQKEYKAVEKELDIVARQRQQQESLLGRHWNNLEETQKALETAQEEQLLRKNQLADDSQKRHEQMLRLKTELETLQASRTQLIIHIAPEWLTRYERMKRSVADPIVSVLSGSCSACFYSVPYQDIVKLKNSGLILCRNCYRFLYYSEEEQTDTKKATF